MTTILIVLAIAAVAAAGAGLAAVRANGAAVLDLVDRLSGGSRGADLVATARYGPDAAQKLRIYAPEGMPGPLPVLIFVHGGSWRSGAPEDYGFVARAFAREGFMVVLAGYRLGTEGRYPAMLRDTAAAVAETARRVPGLGGDPERIVLAGHSAGAYNVVQTVLAQEWLASAGVPSGAIKGVIGLSGPYDFYPYDRDSTRASFGSVGAGTRSQPVNNVRSDAPPMLLVHGESDGLVKPRNTHALAAALKAGGVPVEAQFYPGYDHNDPLIALASPWRGNRPVARRIAAWAREQAAVSVSVQAAKP